MPTARQIQGTIALLVDVAARNGMSDVFLVGGYPRAMAMGMPLSDVHDLDVGSGTPDKAIQLAGLVAAEGHSDKYEILHRTMAVKIEVGGVEIDFQGSKSHDEVLPFLHAWGVQATPIAQNIFDRDFTINSLAMPLGENEIIDMTKRGLPDMDDGKIASILPPAYAVPKNPLMITRAVRFAYKYDFKIDGPLWRAMSANVNKLRDDLSPERLAIEAFVLSKFDCGDMLDDLGLEYMRAPAMVEMGQEVSQEDQNAN